MGESITIEESRYQVFERDHFTCQNCGGIPGTAYLQVAHRVRQGSGSIKMIQNFWRDYYVEKITKKKAKEIINHPLNMATACSLECNASFNIFFNEIKVAALLKRIWYEMETL